MTDHEAAEARKLVKFGIEQGWISLPGTPNSLEWWERPKAKPEDQPTISSFSAGRESESPGEPKP